jgi:hypothetical protein
VKSKTSGLAEKSGAETACGCIPFSENPKTTDPPASIPPAPLAPSAESDAEQSSVQTLPAFALFVARDAQRSPDTTEALPSSRQTDARRIPGTINQRKESTMTDSQKLTITLTGRPPVKIVKGEWPIVASATDDWYDNQYEFQANRKTFWKLIVRQNSDGRTIVYGIYSHSSQFQNESGASVRGGKLITVDGVDSEKIGDTGPIVSAINEIGQWMQENVENDEDAKVFARLINECIADLPAEEL